MPPHAGSKLAQAIKHLKSSRPLVKIFGSVVFVYQPSDSSMQVPRVVYIRQGDPGTEDFISGMIESPAQRQLHECSSLAIARCNMELSGSDKLDWLGAAGLGLAGFSSFVRKESADVLRDGGLS
jgi:hypothetical protein